MCDSITDCQACFNSITDCQACFNSSISYKVDIFNNRDELIQAVKDNDLNEIKNIINRSSHWIHSSGFHQAVKDNNLDLVKYFVGELGVEYPRDLLDKVENTEIKEFLINPNV